MRVHALLPNLVPCANFSHHITPLLGNALLHTHAQGGAALHASPCTHLLQVAEEELNNQLCAEQRAVEDVRAQANAVRHQGSEGLAHPEQACCRPRGLSRFLQGHGTRAHSVSELRCRRRSCLQHLPELTSSLSKKLSWQLPTGATARCTGAPAQCTRL